MEVRKGYACPQGYKQTEVGVIPEDWDVVTLGDVAEIKMCKRIFAEQTSINGDIPFYKIGTFGKKPDAYISKFLYQEYKSNYSFPRKGDILLSAAGTLGRTVVYDGKPSYYQDSNIVWLDVDKNRISNKYLFQYYKIIKWASPEGSTISRLYNGIIRKTKILLPPLAEQEAIAEALSDADALIESLEALLAKKRQVKQGAMSELLTGKRRVVESGEWEVKSFGELFDISGGLSASRDQLSTEGYCYLHYGDIHLSKKTFIDVKAEIQDIPKLNTPLNKVASGSLLSDGDIVFVDASEDDEGASKHVVVVNPEKVPYISGLHTVVAKSKTDELNNLYKRYCFQTLAVKNQFRFYSVGTKVTGISKTNIAKVNLPIPSLAEQTAIAEILSGMDEEIRVLEGKLSKARAVKAGMMSALLTGRVRLVDPSHHDPEGAIHD